MLFEIFGEGLTNGWGLKKYGNVLYSTSSSVAYTGDVGFFVAIPPFSALSLESFNFEALPPGATLNLRYDK